MREEISEKKFDLYKDVLFEIINKNLGVEEEVIASKIKIREVADARRIIVKILKMAFPSSKLYNIGNVVNRGHSNTTLQLIEHKKLLNTDVPYTKKFRLIEFEFKKAIQLKKSLSELQEDKYELERELLVLNSLIQERELKRVTSMIPSVATF